jgi:hypothetical protein
MTSPQKGRLEMMLALAFLIAGETCPIALPAEEPAELTHHVTRTVSRHRALAEDVEAAPLPMEMAAYEISGALPEPARPASATLVTPKPAASPFPVGAAGAGALLAAGAVSAFALRKQRKPQAQTIEVVAQQSLSPKHKLTMIKVGNQQMLLGVSEAGIRLICAMPEGSATPDFTGAEAGKDSFEKGGFEKTLTALELESTPAVATETDGIIRLREARERRQGRSA